eukprot:3998579-Pyramimonas_sp.AAC.1
MRGNSPANHLALQSGVVRAAFLEPNGCVAMLSVSSPPDFKGSSLGDVIEDREYSLRAVACGSRHARPICPGLLVFAMCWKNHCVDLILSYPSTPHTEVTQQGIGCYLTYQGEDRGPSGNSTEGCVDCMGAPHPFRCTPHQDRSPLGRSTEGSSGR